ncbi:hypothetical protein GNQ08_05570 [Paenibacillus macerans]|uniref:Uncharacterized protein n=2 Tax=Paenibacillus macerans TaxID=44252 RepID=A0A6N8ENK3_PAEMA|nr:hypothetical protein [Paenibacillus macerans]MUG21896.1 hypothetical protein [Paenibacillus macerans]OMG46541.1 hypothetical protein BK140_26575 [Paenibacillus macerans]
MKEVVVREENLNRFVNIPWFVNCGKRSNIELLCLVQFVESWEEAEALDEKEDWENVISSGRENLAEFVWKLGYSVRDFNSVVAAVRDSAQYTSAVSEMYEAIEEQNIKEGFGDTIGWLMLNAGIEEVFKDYKGCPKFFREMLEVLKYGHCPCGWYGRWPKGTLYVY